MTTNVAPFPVEARLTQIALAVKPQGLIADQVLPRIPVPGKKFIYSKLNVAEQFTIPDTKVGRASYPNEVEFGGTDVTDSCEDYGLDDFVPNSDLQLAAGTNFNPMGMATEGITTLLELAREKRAADLLFTKSNYNGSLSTTLSGTSQWSHADADPVSALLTAADSLLVRPNLLVIGRAVWTVLRRNSKVVAAVLGKTKSGAALTAAGVLDQQAVADLFEVDTILIGEPFANTAKPGQTASYSRLWGKHAALLRIDSAVRTTTMALPTFGFTAQYGSRIAGNIPDPKRGLHGGQTVRVGESLKELISWQDAGYFWENAVA